MRIASSIKLVLPVVAIAVLGSARANAQAAYGYSSLYIGPSTVTSYSETDIDYTAEYAYYTETDAYLWANSSLADSGSSYSEVDLSTSTDVNTTYWIQTNHWLVGYSGLDVLDFTDSAGGSYGTSLTIYANGENPWATSPVFLGTTNDSGDTNGSAPTLSCSGGGVDESTYGTEVRGTTGYVILYGCNFTTPYGDTYISSSFGSPAYVSESQINLYYSIPTSTASGTRANDIGISTPYGSTSADFHVYDPAPAITSVSPNVWDAGTTTSFSLSGAGFGTSPSLSVTGTGILSYAKTSASDTQINGTVTVDANAPAQNVTITVTSNGYGSGFQSNGGYSNNIATTAQISPATVALNLSRSTLSLVNMAGYPSHGTYTVSSSLSSGNNSAFTVGLTSGMTPQTSPNSMTLTAAANSGPPLQGALKSVSAGFTANSTGGTATKTFSAAAFGMSCYLFAQESDWWNGSSCTSVTISGTTYSGSVTNPPSLTGSYCSAFLAETKLNGSGVSLNGTKIHYQGGNQYAVVSSFVGADGTPLVANGSVARDRSIVPSGTLWLDSIGANILANDTGGAITGYRLDLFKGTGQAACSGFGNPVVVGACNTPTSACPGSGVN